MKSYLKWAGSKAQLADFLIERFPKTFERYLEPFCGSATMFFAYYTKQSSVDIFEAGNTPPALLNDTNFCLINAHEQVAREANWVIEELNKLVVAHKADPEGTYQRVRQEVTSMFHPHPSGVERIDITLSAAQFIYINKTCFNGLWRVNSSNKFNVPFNGRREVGFPPAGLRRCGEMLKKYATLSTLQFDKFLEGTKPGDFVFLDPPYIPLSATSSFTGYTQDGWTAEHDKRLLAALERLDGMGIKFMMTNSSSPLVFEMFGKWKIETVKAHRFVKAINSEGETREMVDETVTTNYKL